MAHSPLYNEMFDADRGVRAHYSAFAEWLSETPPARIAQNRHACKRQNNSANPARER